MLILASVLPAPAHAALDAACGPLGAPTRALQDDADLGVDASDDGGAPTLVEPTQSETYYWAWLDVVVARPGTDADDWFAVDLDGAGGPAMVGLFSNYSTVMPYALELEAYAPGESAPAFRTSSYDGNHTFVNDQPGLWRFHISAPALAGEDDCPATAGAPSPAPQDADRDYGLYFGCNPFCVSTHPHDAR